MLFLANRKRQLSDNIKDEIRRMSAVKWYACVTVKMTKYSPEGDIRDTAKPTFRSVSQTALNFDDISKQMDAAIFKICDNLEKFSREGSGWRLVDVLLLEQTILKYNPLRGSCSDYVLPELLKRKSCLLSVFGTPSNGMECFKYACLAGLHLPAQMTGEIHWSELRQYQNSLNFDGIENRGQRMPLTQIREFEMNNNMSINIFGFVTEVFPLLISKNLDRNTNRHVNLLLVCSSDNNTEAAGVDGHYCLIQDMSRLLYNSETMRHGRLYYCMRCLNPKYSEEQLREHEIYCNELQPMNARMVTEEKKWMEFKSYHRQLECPFAIIADIECFRRKLYDNAEPSEGHTVRERKLEPCAFSYLRICRDDIHPKEPVVYVGKDPEDTMLHFLDCIEQEQRDVVNILSHVQPATLCPTGVQNLAYSKEACHICEQPFLPGDKKVSDHDHMSSVIRGYAHSSCNLRFTESKVLPIFCHGFTKIDSKLIMSAVGKYGHKNISIIPLSVDTYMSVMIGNCRYLDSQRFLNAPLDVLVKSAASETGTFKYLRRFIQCSHLDIFMKTLPFCADYLDCPEKLSESTLPPQKAFYDTIEETDISESDYQVALNVWEAMEMLTLKDYIETYLLSNVLLLTDVLCIFRKCMTDNFRLDPFHYFSLSGYAFDCALRESEAKLELLTEIDMHEMVEANIRGGLSTIGSPRYARANNPDMPKEMYEPDKPNKWIEMFDLNGQYCGIMQKFRLPSYGFRWMTEWEIETFDIMSVGPDSDVGYILECQLLCPEEIHDATDSFPFAPDHIRIKPEDLSEYTRELAEKCGIGLEGLHNTRKLCLTLNDKDRHTGHYLNIQFYVEHGMVLKKIYRGIRFTQTPWLEGFMTKVADLRSKANTELYSKIYKSIPNSVYGKLLESVRSHKNVKIVTTPKQLRKQVSLPTFATLHEFGDDVAAVQLHKEKIVLNRPYAVGFCVLELSKLKLYELFYGYILPTFKQVDLLMADTDCLLVQIHGHENINSILKASSDRFDFSNVPKEHCLYNTSHKRKPGYVKTELGGAVCYEYCALSPKCYSIQTDSGFKQTLKGSSKKLSHEMYKQSLVQEQSHNQHIRELKSYGQDLYQVSIRRRTLTPLDIKRYYLNAIDSLSFGHYKTKEIGDEEQEMCQ